MEPLVDIIVVGPGAIGTILAVRMQAAGHQVWLGARNAASAKKHPSRSVAIDADGTRQEAAIEAIGRPRRGQQADVIVVATKCDDAPAAIKTWRPALRPGGAFVCLQNGVMGDDLAALAKDALVECTVAFPATLEAPGVSQQTGPGDCILGPWPDGRMEAAAPVEAVAEAFAAAVPTRIHLNMAGVKWTKLTINSAITGLGALTGQDLGSLLDDERARDAFTAIVTEGHRAGIAEGIRFEKVAGFHPRLVTRRTGSGFERWRHHTILKILGRKYRRQRSSSLQSLQRGRRTEVHRINGHVVQAAAGHGLAAPVNAAIAAMVKDIEGGELEPALEHLDRLMV